MNCVIYARVKYRVREEVFSKSSSSSGFKSISVSEYLPVSCKNKKYAHLDTPDIILAPTISVVKPSVAFMST